MSLFFSKKSAPSLPAGDSHHMPFRQREKHLLSPSPFCVLFYRARKICPIFILTAGPAGGIITQ